MYVWHIVALIALTLMNGGLAMSEMAIVSARRSRLAAMAEAGDRGAAHALALLGEPSRFLSSVQIGITFVGIAAGALGGATLAEELGERLDRVAWIVPHGETVGFALVIGAITYASLVIGELVPKRLALIRPERIAARVARPMSWLARRAGPLVWLLEASTEGIVRAFGARRPRRGGARPHRGRGAPDLGRGRAVWRSGTGGTPLDRTRAAPGRPLGAHDHDPAPGD